MGATGRTIPPSPGRDCAGSPGLLALEQGVEVGSDPGAVRRAEVARGDVALTVNDDGQGCGCVAEAPGDGQVGVEPGWIGRLVGLETPPGVSLLVLHLDPYELHALRLVLPVGLLECRSLLHAGGSPGGLEADNQDLLADLGFGIERLT